MIITYTHTLLSTHACSCQLGTPTRSLLTTSIQCSGVPLGLLLFSCGLHLRSCFWVRWSGIHRTWLSHCSHLCFSCFSTGTSPTCFMTSTFVCLSHSVIPRMSPSFHFPPHTHTHTQARLHTHTHTQWIGVSGGWFIRLRTSNSVFYTWHLIVVNYLLHHFFDSCDGVC